MSAPTGRRKAAKKPKSVNSGSVEVKAKKCQRVLDVFGKRSARTPEADPPFENVNEFLRTFFGVTQAEGSNSEAVQSVIRAREQLLKAPKTHENNFLCSNLLACWVSQCSGRNKELLEKAIISHAGDILGEELRKHALKQKKYSAASLTRAEVDELLEHYSQTSRVASTLLHLKTIFDKVVMQPNPWEKQTGEIGQRKLAHELVVC